MPTRKHVHTIAATLTLTATAIIAGGSAALAQQPETIASAVPPALAEWSRSVWQSARAGRTDTTIDLLAAESIPMQPMFDASEELQAAAQRLRDNLAHREEMRAASIEEARTKLTEAAGKDDLLDGLRAAIEIDTLSADGSVITDDPAVRAMVDQALTKARAAEQNGDWLEAHGLYARLHLLFDDEHTYREDVRRLARRRIMLRFYTPELLHDLVNERREELGEDPLPPFNALGEDWRDKLKGISQMMVAQAIAASAMRHVEGQPLTEILDGGFRALRTFVTTDDLAKAFPGIANERDRATFVEYLDKQIAGLDQARTRNALSYVLSLLRDLSRINARTVSLPEVAMLHEFADGVMSELDDFSAIIWPGNMEQFERTTSGIFKGVGIQITLNEASEILVVTPLADTPAARAGIRPGDKIRKVDGYSTLGMGLLQAVDRITGDPGTQVTLAIERDGVDDLLEFELDRAEIPIHSIRGWERTGAGELDWNWFIDSKNRIGYVRLTQFTNNTTVEMQQAVSDMQAKGVQALILDMRGNPGGLLSEAVGIVGLFIERGIVVTQEDNRGRRVGQETVRSGGAQLGDMPVVVLVNGGSASASEIVAGALQDHGKAVVVGARSFGKGSVQHVLGLGASAMFKLTTQYYRLPGNSREKGRLIHRTDDSITWGIEPDVEVEMLPEQFAEAFRLRQDGDIVEFDAEGRLVERDDPVDISRLVTEGLDPQLETALLLLQSQVLVPPTARAALD